MKMNEQLTLSRYLYCIDEVALNIVDSLLEKKDLNEVIFWTCEFYNSGYTEDTWLLVWKIYFDFYAINNPLFFKRIYKIWKKRSSIDDILFIIKNLFQFASCWHVFLFRIKKYKSPLSIYISKKSMSKKKRLLLSIKKRHIANLRYHLETIDLTNIDFIIRYFKKNEASTFISYDYPQQLRFHYICYYILSHMELEQPKRTSAVCHKLLKKEKKLSIDIDNIYGYERYKVLPNKRLYEISSKIGCFEKNRDNVIVFNSRLLSLEQIYWYYWLYFAQFSPIWKKRIEEFKGVSNEKTLSIVFPSDEKEEEFYEKYGLEPDEQSQNCHAKSIREIPDNTIASWLNDKFGLELTTNDVRCEIYDYKN